MKKYLSLLFILLPFITEKKLYSMEQKSCENNNSTAQNLTNSLPSFKDLLKNLALDKQSENTQWNLIQEPVFNQPFNQPQNPNFTERNTSVLNIFVNPQINTTSTNDTLEVKQQKQLAKKSTKGEKRKRDSVNPTHNQKRAPRQYIRKLICSLAYSTPNFRALKTQLGAAAKNNNIPLVKSQLTTYISLIIEKKYSQNIILKNGCRLFSDFLEAIYRSLDPEQSAAVCLLFAKISQDLKNSPTLETLNRIQKILSIDPTPFDKPFIASTDITSPRTANQIQECEKKLKKLVENAIQTKTPTEKIRRLNNLRSFIILASLNSGISILNLEQKTNSITMACKAGDEECLKALIIPILNRETSTVKREDRKKLKCRLKETIQNELKAITEDNKTAPALFFLTEVEKSLHDLSDLKDEDFDQLTNNLENLQYAEPLNTNNSLINPPNILKK